MSVLRRRRPPVAPRYTCPVCGHSRQAHTLESSCTPPVHGWRSCGVDGCDCIAAWSAGSDLAFARCSDPSCGFDLVLAVIADRSSR